MTGSLTCEAIARAALGEPAKRQGSELLWRCPRHSDDHPSLSINPMKNLWMCGPCGASGTAWQLAAFLANLDAGAKPAVTAWLRDHGLLAKREREVKMERGPCVAAYIYTDAEGKAIARKLRFEPGADGRRKDFVLERSENGAWKAGTNGLSLPLYRQHNITNEPLVILVEGEKDADAGAKLGLATATAGGVHSFRSDHAESLRGKRVVIVADADEPGRRDAHRVAGLLHHKAASIRLCEVPHCKDLAEAIERGWTRERLLDLFNRAPEWRPADGAEILDTITNILVRFVSMTPAQADATALWIVHTHALDAADCTPYLSINSAEKQSGKTRLLEVLALLVANPWLTGRVTAAVLVRKVDAVQPTLLLDESDAAFGGEKEYAEALRGVLNSGYRRGGAASVCVGQGAAIEYKDFSTFCPKAIAGIGKLPDTVADRSIPIRLKRARRGTVERFRERDAEREATTLREKIEAWAAVNLDRLREARPEIPLTLSDRQADCCEPLLAIADLAGGDWPEKTRTALVELCSEGQQDDDSTGIRLLADIRAIFDRLEADRLTSETLANELIGIETSPWAEWSHGKPISKQKLARLLNPFGIIPGTIRPTEGLTAKGYYRRGFDDAFGRYLPPPPNSKRHNDTTRINTSESCGLQNVTGAPCDDSKNREIASNDAACGVVTLLKRGDKDAEEEVRL